MFDFSQAGFVLLCLAFAIFGISEVPEGGVQFDATHFEDSNFSASSPTTPISPTYVPPPPADTDVETGHASANNDATTQDNSSYVQVQPEDAAAPVEPVDLLDDAETGSSKNNKNDDGGIHELD